MSSISSSILTRLVIVKGHSTKLWNCLIMDLLNFTGFVDSIDNSLW